MQAPHQTYLEITCTLQRCLPLTLGKLQDFCLFRNKSKMFTSRLAEQRARLVVMLRRGDLPEELQNEKIVELHLQKKQVCVTMIIDHHYFVPKPGFIED